MPIGAAWQTLAPRLPPGLLPRSGGTPLPLPPGQQQQGFLCVGGYTEEEGGQARAPTGEALAVRLWGSPPVARLPPTGPAPPPRLASAGATVGSTAWIIGGWDPGTRGDGGVILDDLWSADLTPDPGGGGALAWTPHPAAPLPGGPASRHAAAPLGDGRILVLTHRCGERLLVLDVSQPGAPAWSSLAATPDAGGAGFPSSRGLASLVALPSACEDGSTTLLLFGGAPRRGGMEADLWRLRVRGPAAAWERVGPPAPGGSGPASAAAPWPPARCSHVAAAAPGGMVVWGGSFYHTAGTGGLVARGDAWWWDEGTGAWSALECDGGDPPPLPRNAAAAAAVTGPDGRAGVLVSGGWDPFRVTFGDTAVLWLG